MIGVAGLLGVLVLLVPVESDDGRPIPVVGAGAVDLLESGDAPAGFAYRLSTRDEEPVAKTARRIERALRRRPDTLVVAFDAGALPSDRPLEREQIIVAYLVEMAAASPSRVLMLGFVPAPDASRETLATAARMNAWWIGNACNRRLQCIAPPDHHRDADALHRAVADAIARALSANDAPPTVPRS